MRATEKTIERFKLWASPAILLSGIVWGLIFVLFALLESRVPARLVLSSLFISGSILAFSYTEPKALRSHTLPLLVEMLRYVFLFFFLFGIVWLIRIFGNDPAPQKEWALFVISFLMGSIAGSVWCLGFILFLGRKKDVVAWHVVRFPLWTKGMAAWVLEKIGRD